MKKLILGLVICIASLSTPLKAAYDNVISANPFTLINWGRFNVTFEHKIDKLNSFTVFIESYNTKYYNNWTGYGIGGSYRWYISPFNDNKRSLEGFSFGPLAVLSFWESKYSDKYKYNYSGQSLSIGGEAAYKWVWGGFALEPSLILMLDALTVDHRDDKNHLSWNVKIGYAW